MRSLVNQIIDERTGYMLRFKTPSVILEGAVCGATYSDWRHFCPREIYPYWRTIWLKPVGNSQPDTESSDARPHARPGQAEQMLP